MFAYELPGYSAEVNPTLLQQSHHQFSQAGAEMQLNKMPQVTYMRRRLPHEMSRYDFVTNDMAASANPYYGNQLVLSVPLVMGADEHAGGPHGNKRRKNSSIGAATVAASGGVHSAAYKRHKVQSHPLDARTIPYLGKSKISRLATLGVLTVEDLANVNPDDRRLAVAATTNHRSDHAKRTLQRWYESCSKKVPDRPISFAGETRQLHI